MTNVSSRLRMRALGALLLVALACAACDDASGGSGDESGGGVTFEDGLPVVMSLRVVCRLASDTPSAIAADITGADGTQSVVAGGRTYWFFGDTVRNAGDRQDVIPAAVATTTDRDARDCIDLQFKTSADGVVTPMFPRLDETTAWPDGVLALDDGSIAFYMVKALRQSPFAWHVASVGLGRIPPGSVDGERVVETIWDENSGFGTRVAGVRSPVRMGDDVIVYLLLDDHRNVVARAPVARMAEFAAYTYWDGDGWSSDPADAATMWESEESEFPPDNGVQVSFDDRIGKWIARVQRPDGVGEGADGGRAVGAVVGAGGVVRLPAAGAGDVSVLLHGRIAPASDARRGADVHDDLEPEAVRRDIDRTAHGNGDPCVALGRGRASIRGGFTGRGVRGYGGRILRIDDGGTGAERGVRRGRRRRVHVHRRGTGQ